MSEVKKRSYKSTARDTKAAETRARILSSAKNLFEAEGFEYVTIEKIAQTANVSIPTVYSLFQSKRGILRALMDEALPLNQFNALVEMSIEEKSPKERLGISAKIARQIYDAERAQISIFRGAIVLAPEFRELEKEREMRRYERQEVTIKAMVKEHSLMEGLDPAKARDILWALTGRDMYRMFVIEQAWSSDEYEKWLTQQLINSLIDEKKR
jgi:AcrR family transcriptional regulator